MGPGPVQRILSGVKPGVLLLGSLPSSGALAPAAQEPSLPFSFTLGSTTLEQAEIQWRNLGVQVIRKGPAAANGFLFPTGDEVPAERIILVEVADVSFVGPNRMAQFAFFDGVLYKITQRFYAVLKQDEKYYVLEEKINIKAFEKDLKKAYGPPTRSSKSIFDGHVCIWKMGPRQLIFKRGGLEECLIFMQTSLQDAAMQYKAALNPESRKKAKRPR